jgi:hypothetical protein
MCRNHHNHFSYVLIYRSLHLQLFYCCYFKPVFLFVHYCETEPEV